MNDLNPNSNVLIKVQRVFDSCSDKDCLANLPVTITAGTLPTNVNIIRSRAASVGNICVNVEPIPFNKGFYSIDLTITFQLEIQCFDNSCSAPATLYGTAYATKNCILYGSESSVKTFTSAENGSLSENSEYHNLPLASVSVLEPVVLETKIAHACPTVSVPAQQANSSNIYVTLGLFSVVELSRPVTLMVNTNEYTIPRKECCSDTDSPCEVFEKLKFPENEFTPTALTDSCECEGLDEIIG